MSHTTKPKPKTEQPETPHQARRHDGLFLRYRHAGLCVRCASQAAWAVFCGWSSVHLPCSACAATMHTSPVFTTPKLNGWVALPAAQVGFGASKVTSKSQPGPQIATQTTDGLVLTA